MALDTFLVKFSEPTIGLAFANPNCPHAALTHTGEAYTIASSSGRTRNFMDQPLITVDAALHALASANTPDELITIADQAAALQVYCRAIERAGRELSPPRHQSFFD